MTLVVDASIAVKWFFPEIYQENALRVLTLKKKLVAPDLLWPEFGSVVWKKHQRRDTTLEEASMVVDKFMACAIECCPTQFLVARAVALAYFTGAGIYDSFYLALADENNYALVSADKRMCEAAKKAHIRHFWIEDIC